MPKMKSSAGEAVVSIHDVMPQTLPLVMQIIDLLEADQVHPLTLLVVPGKNWSADQIYQLKVLQQRGIDLAGHGWRHKVYRKDTFRHRLHAIFLSRDEAEHLSLSEAAVRGTISRCYRWFSAVGLSPPDLYVPPAWAMGDMPRSRLHTLPFGLYETLSGVYELRSARYYKMPVIGYMADTGFRAIFLKIVNAVSMGQSQAPKRVAIHPHDLHLPLMPDLIEHLARFSGFLKYTDITNERAVPVPPCYSRSAA